MKKYGEMFWKLRKKGETFSDTLTRLIKEEGLDGKSPFEGLEQ